MKLHHLVTATVLATVPTTAVAQDTEAEPIENGRPEVFLQTSLFMLGNLLPEPPSFYQLNVGVYLTERDALIVEAITWTYPAPLGIQYWDGYGDPALNYPGHVRDWGLGVAWQHIWWKGLYTTAHITPFVHSHHDAHGDRLQTGFMLWLSGRVGYHIDFANDRLFIEPSVAFNAWPVQTRQPADFAAEDARWPRYFLLEPGFHVGVRL